MIKERNKKFIGSLVGIVYITLFISALAVLALKANSQTVMTAEVLLTEHNAIETAKLGDTYDNCTFRQAPAPSEIYMYDWGMVAFIETPYIDKNGESATSTSMLAMVRKVKIINWEYVYYAEFQIDKAHYTYNPIEGFAFDECVK